MNTSPPEALLELQKQFAGHIRDPDHVPPPNGIEDRRMAIYRRLFFNNLKNLLAAQFPVVRAQFDGPAWDNLIRDFMVSHRATTPLFPELPNEFIGYLTENHDRYSKPPQNQPPFLLELAHFEWRKRRMRLNEVDPNTVECDRDGDLLQGIPVVSPLAELASYRFPVHRISTEFRPETPPQTPTLLLIYRALDDRGGYLAVNPVSARLFELLLSNLDRSGQNLLRQIAEELGRKDAEKVIQHGREVLAVFKQHDILLGTGCEQ